jgi:hypothetical protein
VSLIGRVVFHFSVKPLSVLNIPPPPISSQDCGLVASRNTAITGHVISTLQDKRDQNKKRPLYKSPAITPAYCRSMCLAIGHKMASNLLNPISCFGCFTQ